jgi:CubicO group peptidase (beta-lactamase class C family)
MRRRFADMTHRRLALLTLPLVFVAALATAQQPLPAATPEAVGLSGPRVERLKAVVQDYVTRNQIAGVTVVIARGGKLALFEPIGRMDVEKNLPLKKDTIFRMASMSKAVTSVAAVILMEEGKLRLADPVSRYLPAFKKTTVVVPSTGGRPGTVPAKREITVRDLLTHTSGVNYGDGPAADEYRAAGLFGWYLADKAEPIVPLMERLAALPFVSQPGEKYVYGYSTDILGAVVEKASGMPLDEFCRTRVFEPLKMTDSAFFVDKAKRERVATVYGLGQDGKIARAPEAKTGQGEFVDGPRACFGGGAGLTSTAGDYLRFLQMLLNGGELDGVRVLGPKSVQMMTSNQTGRLYREDGGLGFGLGFETTEDVGAAGRPDSVGSFGWGSAYYSKYWVDPQEKLVALFMTQLLPAANLDLQDKFRYLVYQAIVGPVPPAPPAPKR